MQRRPKIEGGQTTGAWDRLRWPYGDTRARGLRGKARRTDKSNVDSEDTVTFGFRRNPDVTGSRRSRVGNASG